jgi:hypothetical protein
LQDLDRALASQLAKTIAGWRLLDVFGPDLHIQILKKNGDPRPIFAVALLGDYSNNQNVLNYPPLRLAFPTESIFYVTLISDSAFISIHSLDLHNTAAVDI